MKKNMKFQILTVLVLAMLVIVSGCTKVEDDAVTLPVTETTKPQETVENTFGKAIEFEVVYIDDIPLDIRVEIEAQIIDRGYYTWRTDDGMTYLLISSGEKPTGGYGIELISLAEYNGVYKVLVGEGKPAADAMVPQVITYPFVVVKFVGDFEVTEVADESSVVFERFAESMVKLLTVEGEYQGQIDNSSIEVKVGENYMAFRNYEFDSLLEGIETGDMVTIQYIVNEEMQNMLYSIEK